MVNAVSFFQDNTLKAGCSVKSTAFGMYAMNFKAVKEHDIVSEWLGRFTLTLL